MAVPFLLSSSRREARSVLRLERGLELLGLGRELVDDLEQLGLAALPALDDLALGGLLLGGASRRAAMSWRSCRSRRVELGVALPGPR